MGVKNKNIPDKGAVVEKDLETYTIIPYIPVSYTHLTLPTN
jgi:hypothetical protein